MKTPLILTGLANAMPTTSSAEIVIPYGWFPHSQGMQRFFKPEADTLAANIAAEKDRLGSRFVGYPIYIGHPDVPGAPESKIGDKKAYGWLMNGEAREDGFALTPEWSEPGKQLVENKHYRFYSPVWGAVDDGRKNGQNIKVPVRFVSLGLTNDPNIPVEPLANTATKVDMARAHRVARRRTFEGFYGLVD